MDSSPAAADAAAAPSAAPIAAPAPSPAASAPAAASPVRTPAPTPARGRDGRPAFARRLVSTVLLWSLLLGTVFSGLEWAYFLLIGSLGLLGLWEFYEMLEHKRLPNNKVFGLLCGALFFLASFFFFYTRSRGPSEFEMVTLLVFLFGAFGRQLFERTRDHSPLETMAFTVFGLLYVPWLFNFVARIIYLVPHPPHAPVGQYYVIYLIAVAKFSDMGAYLVGSLLGRHKMIPHVSPAKTWEGFAGALGFSLLASLGLRALWPGKLALLTWTDAWVLGLLLSVAAVIGDLAESILKRSTDVKDSGRALPGIGGVLDLIDSILFTAPTLFFYLLWRLG